MLLIRNFIAILCMCDLLVFIIISSIVIIMIVVIGDIVWFWCVRDFRLFRSSLVWILLLFEQFLLLLLFQKSWSLLYKRNLYFILLSDSVTVCVCMGFFCVRVPFGVFTSLVFFSTSSVLFCDKAFCSLSGCFSRVELYKSRITNNSSSSRWRQNPTKTKSTTIFSRQNTFAKTHKTPKACVYA